ncbi:uncharacterized protein LOC122630768 [Vespula pensylvanica]|uniref:uncharacterized protein LOC122630768 n=1 Tax=Vespula pensylvanica TaxID=30213 RepID=UPI001CB9DB79|nr:uncharacterized protein LOC122630768 [Vespula pensylvanica]
MTRRGSRTSRIVIISHGNLTMKAKPYCNYVDDLSYPQGVVQNYICQKQSLIFTVSSESIPYGHLFFFSFISYLLLQMLQDNLNNIIAVFLFFAVHANCVPKYDDRGFIPSSITYMEKVGKAQDQVAMPSQAEVRTDTSTKHGETTINDISDRNQEARFGFTNIGSSGSGYAISPYAPAKIDLGGLLLGAIIGVGSILIIPKLLYVLSGTYGNYARSEENGFAQSMTKLDDALARHGIDTTSCMQRAVCTYSQQAAAAIRVADEENEDEKISSFDRMIDAITTNQVFRTAMQGTAIQEAVEAGHSGKNCSYSYPHCGFSLETMLSLLSNVITAVSTANARAASSTASSLL